MPGEQNVGTSLVVVSPHLDDAVLGLGERIAQSSGAVIVTVFAGSPTCGQSRLTSWDARAGFSEGDDVMAVRRAEDAAAAAVLGATTRWLGFLDSQYGPPPSCDAVATAIHAVLDELGAPAAAIPVGLFHDDHRLVGAACEHLVAAGLPVRWLAYEEAIYRRRAAEETAQRIASLGRFASWSRQERTTKTSLAKKRIAVACYASQMRALRASFDESTLATVFDPEVVWSADAHG